MKNLQNEISMGLTELSSKELVQFSGGWEWLDAVAGGIEYFAGKVTHAVIDTALILTGNYQPH